MWHIVSKIQKIEHCGSQISIPVLFFLFLILYSIKHTREKKAEKQLHEQTTHANTLVWWRDGQSNKQITEKLFQVHVSVSHFTEMTRANKQLPTKIY